MENKISENVINCHLSIYGFKQCCSICGSFQHKNVNFKILAIFDNNLSKQVFFVANIQNESRGTAETPRVYLYMKIMYKKIICSYPIFICFQV
jgi:hypothetical protein